MRRLMMGAALIPPSWRRWLRVCVLRRRKGMRQGPMQNRGFALTTGDLMAFLNGTEAAPVVVSDPCAPVVARAGQ